MPRDLVTIIGRCIAKEPQARYATADALAEDLARFLDHRPIKAKPASPLSQAARWIKRRPSVSLLIAMTTSLILFLAVAGPLSAWRQRSLIYQLEQQLYEASITNSLGSMNQGDVDVASTP